MSVQSVYNTYPDLGYPGDIARPSEPHAFDTGLAQVPSNGRKPRPGDAVYYDRSANGFAVPTSDPQRAAVVGIVSFDPGVVQSTAASTPSGSNTDKFIEYDDGDELKVVVFGVVWVEAGSAMEYGQLVQQDTYSSPDYLWDPYTTDLTIEAATSVADLRTEVVALADSFRSKTFTCVSPAAVAANGLAQVRISQGRII